MPVKRVIVCNRWTARSLRPAGFALANLSIWISTPPWKASNTRHAARFTIWWQLLGYSYLKSLETCLRKTKSGFMNLWFQKVGVRNSGIGQLGIKIIPKRYTLASPATYYAFIKFLGHPSISSIWVTYWTIWVYQRAGLGRNEICPKV